MSLAKVVEESWVRYEHRGCCGDCRELQVARLNHWPHWTLVMAASGVGAAIGRMIGVWVG